jgi:hypothetical protein
MPESFALPDGTLTRGRPGGFKASPLALPILEAEVLVN